MLTYNIHKGFHHLRRTKVLALMREAIRAEQADLVLLQEVLGLDREEDASQLEYLADEIWRTRKIRVDRRKIRLEEPIKAVGAYLVEIDVFTDVRAAVKTQVVAA